MKSVPDHGGYTACDRQPQYRDQLKRQAASNSGDDVQLRALDRQAKALRDLLDSYLAKNTEAEKAARAEALQLAGRRATEVPMRTAKLAARMLALLPELVEKGNPSAASDAGSAALLLEAAAEGALLNVGINLSGIDDAAFVAAMQRDTAEIQADAQRFRAHVLAAVRKSFAR